GVWTRTPPYTPRNAGVKRRGGKTAKPQHKPVARRETSPRPGPCELSDHGGRRSGGSVLVETELLSSCGQPPPWSSRSSGGTVWCCRAISRSTYSARHDVSILA